MASRGEAESRNASPEGRGPWQEESFGFVLYDALTDTLYEGDEQGADILAIHTDDASQVRVSPSPDPIPDVAGSLFDSLLVT